MRRVGVVLLVAGLASCASAPPATPAATVRVPAVTRDAGPPPARNADPPPAPVDVRVSFLGDDGAYLGPFYDPRPDAAALIRPCFERAREDDRTLTGFVLFDVALSHTAPAQITTREASPLPASLVACAAAALGALRPRDPSFVPPPSTAYVSLR
jgi:hypothetical protein